MGCSQSKLDDEEAVQLCKDRKRFIKQAVEHRTQFAAGHIAYIQSLKRVSAALHDYFEGNGEQVEFTLDSFITPLKKSKSSTPTTIEFGPNTTLKVNYLAPGGNPAISVEERPASPEMVRVETCSPMRQFGIDGFFAMQSSPMNASIFAYSPNNMPIIPPTSPQHTHWDSFWNPFTSLDYYGYPTRTSLDHTVMDDESKGLRQAREEEGIPDLEEDETEKGDSVPKTNVAEEITKIDVNSSKEEVMVEDVDEHEDGEKGIDAKTEAGNEISDSQANGSECFLVSKAQTSGHIESGRLEMAIGKEETPGFTVYVNRRPTSMAEVIKDLEAQFAVVCNAANDVSALLEANEAQYLSTSNVLSASKLLNPAALFRSASSLSSSSKFEGSDDPSMEHCMLPFSHQSTLDRLYAWEKKLYEEVRSGARARLAYEKKCQQLRKHGVEGEEPSSMDKTKAAIRDLHTQITVSMHSIEAISKRIETLRDEELHPQLLELMQRLARMWKVMAESHQTQKIALDEAKILLDCFEVRKQCAMSITDPQKLARSASNLETELRNWRNAFESWITSQRSYIHALTGWLLRCVKCEPDSSKLACSPRRTSDTHPMFGLCVHWSRRLDAIQEITVVNGIDIFAAGIGSLYAPQLRDDSRRLKEPNEKNMEVVEVGEVEEVMATEQMAEVAVKVLCAGMSSAMSSMAEFAIDSAKGYNELVKQWENVKLQHACETAK